MLISQSIQKHKLSAKDQNLLTEIVYGTMERKLTLDYFLEDYIQKQKKVADWVRMLLRLSVFQFAYLDKVPAFAVINEAVNIAKRKGHKGIASFVNGVLRNIDRHGLKSLESIKNPNERLSIETSHPLWLVERWIEYYGFETAKAICFENNEKKALSIRVNTLKISREALMEQLTEKKGFAVRPSAVVDKGIIIDKGNIFKTDYLDHGYCSVQDQSSMLAASMLQTEQDMTVLDTCSAPGGKTGYIGEQMQNTGAIHAFDLHKNKIKLIANNSERLGLTNVSAKMADARELQTLFEAAAFDRILIDAPCSGFGVIRSKPDIKYSKQPKDIDYLQQVQMSILQHVAPLLKNDGKIVYSTCTIEKKENEKLIQAFLESHDTFKVDESFLKEAEKYDNCQLTPYGLQIFPQTFHADGFFITRLIKIT